MNYFWYDHKLEDEMGGTPQLEGFDRFLAALGVTATQVDELPNGAESEGVYFVHAGDYIGKNEYAWGRVHGTRKKVYVIFVSSNPTRLVNNAYGAYCINAPLIQVVQLLNSDPSRAGRFVKSCNAGAPDMSCFARSYPECLLAAYLVGLAKQNGLQLDIDTVPEEVWSNASQEYVDHGGRMGVTIDSSTDILKIPGIKEILAGAGPV